MVPPAADVNTALPLAVSSATLARTWSKKKENGQCCEEVIKNVNEMIRWLVTFSKSKSNKPQSLLRKEKKTVRKTKKVRKSQRFQSFQEKTRQSWLDLWDFLNMNRVKVRFSHVHDWTVTTATLWTGNIPMLTLRYCFTRMNKLKYNERPGQSSTSH